MHNGWNLMEPNAFFIVICFLFNQKNAVQSKVRLYRGDFLEE